MAGIIKKIYVNKSDEPALIAEKIIDANAEEIVLNIPKFSKFSESLSNFHLIKREAETLGKKLVIESVDDKVIELCGISGIESINPFFVKSKRQFSDIVVQKSSVKRDKEISKLKYAEATKEISDENGVKKRSRIVEEGKNIKHPVPRFNLRKLITLVGIGGGAILFLIIIFNVLPRAEIEIITKKINWEYTDSAQVDKALASIDSDEVKIPGQLFSQTSNMVFSYPASGRKNIEKQASGTITIYNAYSSDPQPLVVRTRFETLDGKIYRLTKDIIVPGAKIVNGQIIPSTIDAKVIADKPGTGYNIGPVEKYTIPGFKNSPKFQSFYGRSTEPMSGGFIGEAAYPLDSDIKKAKSESIQKLEDSLRTSLTVQIPQGFKAIEGSDKFTVIKEEIIDKVDASGNFSVFVEGKLNILAFREEDLNKALTEKANDFTGKDMKIKSFDLQYVGKARTNFELGQMSFPIAFTAVLAPKIEEDALRKQIIGNSEIELQATIFALPDVESAQVSLWPFWVKSVPKNESRIKISIN